MSTENETDKQIWVRMARGMEKSGFKIVLRMHKDISNKEKTRIANLRAEKYPHEQFEHKWYHDHLGYNTMFVKAREPEEVETYDAPMDQYKDAIIARIDKQNEKGLEKYGTSLENATSIGALDRMDHLAEELTDGLQYIEHIKVLMNKHNDGLSQAVARLIQISNAGRSSHKSEINQIAKDLHELYKELNGNENI